MTNPSESLYYGDYLMLPSILNAQIPESKKLGREAHDETLFIITHQTYELWFKQMIHELRSMQLLMQGESLADRDLLVFSGRLERVVMILNLLNQQVAVLETMTPLDFLEFRDLLMPASGFQSVQFREIETRLGLPRTQRSGGSRVSVYSRLNQEDREHLQAVEKQDSLFQLVDAWLNRMPFLAFDDYDFWDEYESAVSQMLASDREIIENNKVLDSEERERELAHHQVSVDSFRALFDAQHFEVLREQGGFRLSRQAVLGALFIHLYRDEPMLQSPFRVLNGLVEVDELLVQWRVRHAVMAHRMLGRKIGTGGSAGYDYLKATADAHRVYADFFSLATFLVPRSRRPALSGDLKRALGFFFSGEGE